MRKSHVLSVLVLLALGWVHGCGGAPEPGAEPGPAAPPERAPDAPAPGGPAAGAPIAGSGTIRGTVTFAGEVPKLKPLRMDADPSCLAKHADPVLPEVLVLGDDNRMANVFVQVKTGLPAAEFPPPSEPAVLDQRGCRYTPRVMGVMVNQPVKILNSDGLLHNVHSLPKKNKSFNRAMPAAVTEVDYSFSEEESMFKIKCDVHPWMSAYVAVMAHPYFAVTGEDGAYAISELPAGTYEIEAWHERLGTRSGTLALADGETAEIDFTFDK